MSGKSTLLRSVTAAALLANCGLAVPIQQCQNESHSGAVEDCVITYPALGRLFFEQMGQIVRRKG